MKKGVLITGGSGLLALNWAGTVCKDYAVTLGLHDRQVNLNGITSVLINLDSIEAICNRLEESRSEMVVHTAGLTSVESCEKNPALAKNINTHLAENVAAAAKRMGCKLVHISTDHLFDGTKPNLDENSPVNPLNMYAKTKADAEVKVLSNDPRALVIRTNFYGWGPNYRPSFSDMIINKLRDNKQVFLYHDVFYTPILLEDLITTAHGLVDKDATGIYHVGGKERISKYAFGLAIADRFGLDRGLIVSSSIKDNPDLVLRPMDMSLSSLKTGNFLGKETASIEDQVKRLHEQENSDFAEEIRKL